MRILKAAISEELHRAQVPDAGSRAAAAARKVVLDLQFTWGGQQFYIPIRSELLYQKIYDDFMGDNVPDLVRKYRLSTKQIYKIIKRERDRRAGIAPEQARLPGL